jgi:hypothetical protein
MLRIGTVAGVLASFGGWTLTSPVFALESISVEGTERVARGWVLEQLAPWRGHNLMALDLEAAERLLRRHRWVQAVELEKVLPDRLVVRLIEHRPVAVLATGDSLLFIDAHGRLISVATTAADGWLTLRAAEDRDSASALETQRWRQSAVGLAAAIAAELPAWRVHMTAIELLGGGDLGLRFEQAPERVIVDPDSALERLIELERLLPYLRNDLGELDEIDLRFQGRIVLRVVPAAPASGGTSHHRGYVEHA